MWPTHGILNTHFPGLSAIVPGRTGNQEHNDGIVSAGGWPVFNLKGDLLVIGACDTGRGKTIDGAGVPGLAHTSYLALNRDTRLTLWPIDDQGG